MVHPSLGIVPYLGKQKVHHRYFKNILGRKESNQWVKLAHLSCPHLQAVQWNSLIISMGRKLALLPPLQREADLKVILPREKSEESQDLKKSCPQNNYDFGASLDARFLHSNPWS